ncbi:Mov34/MPN/PAD-1 family protein [Sphingomonas sp.]|uniref:Mov34/MPN/PAD-1 family protein n=1 Tax=Sphingomonas sp. TaxID=28214 RepID=UPI0035C86BA7
MDRTLRISRSALTAIRAEADAAGDEICGLLLGVDIAQARACRNVHPQPARHFEIDPAALLAAHRAARNGGPPVIGHYHSHPSGDPRPSLVDAADAPPDGAIWLIIGVGATAAWIAVRDGTVHGRFDPVAIVPA